MRQSRVYKQLQQPLVNPLPTSPQHLRLLRLGYLSKEKLQTFLQLQSQSKRQQARLVLRKQAHLLLSEDLEEAEEAEALLELEA